MDKQNSPILSKRLDLAWLGVTHCYFFRLDCSLIDGSHLVVDASLLDMIVLPFLAGSVLLKPVVFEEDHETEYVVMCASFQ